MRSKFLFCAFLAISALLIIQFSNANNSSSPDFLTSKPPESSSSPNNQDSSQDKSLLEKTKSLFQNSRDILQQTFNNASESLNNLKESLVSEKTIDAKFQEKKETENSTPNPPNQDNTQEDKLQDNPPLNDQVLKTTDAQDIPSDLEKKTPETPEISQNKTEESQSWLSQSLNNLKDKTGSVYQGVKETTESVYEGVKDKALPALSTLSDAAQEKASQLGGAAKEKMSGALDQIAQEIPVPGSFIVKHWTLIKWVGVILGVCFVIRVILGAFSCIQCIVKILKAPKEFVTHPYIKWLPAKIINYAQKLAERIQGSKTEKGKRDSQDSFTEGESGRNMDQSLEMAESTDDETSENEEKSYGYYKCGKCQKKWDNVIIGKNQTQKCKKKGCLVQVEPYRQIPLCLIIRSRKNKVQ